MNAEPSQVAILFADISGSCEIFQKLGNDAARQTMSGLMDVMENVVKDFDGQIIKTIGDEIMCRFPSADLACQAACKLQQTAEIYSRNESPESLELRIGFHFGDVVHEDNDVFGDSVNVAARLAAYAKASQIVTSGESKSLCPSIKNSRQLDRVRLRGREQKVEIVEVFWKHDISTTVSASVSMSDDTSSLVLQLGEKTLYCNEENFKISIGRDPGCDFPVNCPKASRNHATIEYRRGAFVLTDISTNATYFRQGLEETRLHREAMPIFSGGQISLGIPFRKNPVEVIEIFHGDE